MWDCTSHNNTFMKGGVKAALDAFVCVCVIIGCFGIFGCRSQWKDCMIGVTFCCHVRRGMLQNALQWLHCNGGLKTVVRSCFGCVCEVGKQSSELPRNRLVIPYITKQYIHEGWCGDLDRTVIPYITKQFIHAGWCGDLWKWCREAVTGKSGGEGNMVTLGSAD